MPGAKLCSPCRAALKRAKDDSVWELPPSQRQGEAQPASPRPAQWVLGSPRFNGWRPWALGGVALAACVIVGLHYARSGEPAAAFALPSVDVRPIGDAPPPSALQRALPPATPMVLAPTPTSSTVTHTDDALVQPPRSEHSVPRTPKTRPAAEPVAQPAPPVVEPPPPEPVRVAPPAPPPPPARPVDPMQRLDDALGRCRGQDLFSRLGCEYQARTTYCQGHWGESPQCPAPTNNDHGQ